MKNEQIEQGGGNKQPPLNEHKECKFQSISWVMTWNNYPNDVFEQLEKYLVPDCIKYVFSKEVGKEGTPHIQGAFILRAKKRQGTIYNMFKTKFFLDKMHGKWDDQKYCVKDNGEVLSNVVFKVKRPKDFLKFEQLNAWELKIDNICSTEKADDRKIFWFWSQVGAVGKTSFCKYLHNVYDCCIIGGKAADSKNCVATYIERSDDKRAPEIVICNIPKSQDFDFVSYEGIESIKDMFFYSGKYEGLQVNDNSPHLFVFANEEPDRSKMSMDRWLIYEIVDKEGNYIAS